MFCLKAFSAYITTVTEPRFQARENLLFCDRYVYNDDNKSNAYTKICSKHIRKTYKSFLINISLTISSVAIGVANPLYILYRDGVFYTLTGVSFPFVQRNSEFETIVNLFYQAITASIASLAYIIMQVGYTIICDTMDVTADLTVLEMKILTKHLQRNDLKNIQIQNRLNRMFQQIKIVDEIVLSTGQVWYWHLFTSPYVLTYSIGLSIYAQYNVRSLQIEFVAWKLKSIIFAGRLSIWLRYCCDFIYPNDCDLLGGGGCC